MSAGFLRYENVVYLCSSYLVCSKDSSQMRPQASSNSISRVSVRQTGLWICVRCSGFGAYSWDSGFRHSVFRIE